MLENFFKLNGKVGKIESEEELLSHLERSDNLKNVLYIPETFSPKRPKNRLRNKTFVNVSFSKTSFINIEFTGCHFTDCLFLGSTFENCELHDCTFESCNPYKAQFRKTYINPEIFSGMLNPKEHSNIGTYLFQQLLYNATESRQTAFAQAAEYHFRKWMRYQLAYDLKNNNLTFCKYLKKWVPDILYDIFAGYGLKTRPFLFWSSLIFLSILFVNHYCWEYFKMTNQGNSLPESHIITSFYYTVITISTLGYGDITPTSHFGMAMAGFEALFGLLWLSILASIIIKRVAR